MFGSTILSACGPTINYANGSGTGTATCGPGPDLTGDTGITIEVIYMADYSAGNFATTNTAQVVFTPQNLDGGWSPASMTCTATGTFNSATDSCNNPPPAPTVQGNFSSALGTQAQLIALAGSSFTVSETATLVQGTVSNSTGTVFVQYDYSAPTTGAPEPTTMALVGSALIGLGIIGRKRLAR
jgi:hypothetical protein